MKPQKKEWWEKSGRYQTSKAEADFIADCLLDDGWIRPPCKVGDKINYIDRYSNEVEEDVIKFFTITRNGVKPILTRHNTKFWDMYEWGKTVFLTKSEAEQKLKEVRGENADTV